MLHPHTHATPYSGTWYPGDRAALRRLLDARWEESAERTGDYVASGARAFLVPHAGLEYSGTVAAAVYRQIELARPERVILAGFSHRGAPAGVWIPDAGRYATPLGEVEVDAGAVASLSGAAPFQVTEEERVCDHSVEIQLPLLQRAAPGARIIPIYVSSLDTAARAVAAGHLAKLMTPGTVLVASSDLTHYGPHFGYTPFPADAAVAERLHDLDHRVLEAIGSLEIPFFVETLQETGSTVCGVEPIALLLATLGQMESDGECYQQVLDYCASGEITGDFRSSVSYGSAAFYPYRALELDEAAGQAVLALASGTLKAYQATGRRHVPKLPPSGVAALQRRAALFVSLHQHGCLRGCLGRTAAVQSIEGAVPELTMAAALEDPRFHPVAASETELEIEVSILSPMKRWLHCEHLRAGVHGALLAAKGRQGLLLPQVASDRNWGTEPFLDALAAKTGVRPADARDPASRLYVFRAQVIH